MVYRVPAEYAQRQRVLDLAVLPLVLVLLLAAVGLDVVEAGSGLVSFTPVLVVFAVLRFTSKQALQSYAIDGDRLRLGPQRSYPIRAIRHVEVRDAGNGAARLVVTAEEFARHRTPPLVDGAALARELQAVNPRIALY